MCLAGLGQLTNLRELRVAGNRLAALPRELGALAKLHRLVADGNALTALPRASPRISVYRFKN